MGRDKIRTHTALRLPGSPIFLFVLYPTWELVHRLFPFPPLPLQENKFGKAKADGDYSGAPKDNFLSDPLKRYFRLSGAPLKLWMFILGHAIIFLTVRSFKGNLSLFEITRSSFVPFPKTLGLISFPKILADLFSVPETTFLSTRKHQALNFSYHESWR